jgi:PhnB protein
MLHCTPFLLFDGNCAEGMKFYHECIGGELILTKTGDTPMKHQFPPEMHNKIIYSHIKSGAIEFSATDWHDSKQMPKHGNTVGIYIIGKTFDELKAIFDKLSSGAHKEHFVDLQDMPFGSYGHFYDKYGISWFFKGDKKE